MMIYIKVNYILILRVAKIYSVVADVPKIEHLYRVSQYAPTAALSHE